MNSFFEFFLARMSATFRANLTGESMVNLSEVFSTLPAYPGQQVAELTETTIEHLFAQKTFGSHFKVDILNKNHVCHIAEKMTSLKVKVFTSIRDLMVKSSYFSRCSIL
jgi:hypothetical protein